MPSFTTTGLVTGALMGLVACGGGGSGGEGEGGSGGGGGGAPADPSPLFFGSTDPAASRSGLDYASDTAPQDDLRGQTHTVRVLRTVTNNITGDVETRITDEVVTFSGDFSDEQDEFIITLDGESLTFTGFVIDSFGRATRQDGTNLFSVNLRAFDFLEHAEVIRIINDDIANGPQDDNTVGHFVTGFETNPSTLAAIGGSATYTGPISWLTKEFEDGLLFAPEEGEFTLNAQFGDGLVDGAFSFTELDAGLSEAGNVTLLLAPTAMTGNGFAGDLTIADCSFDACTSASEIGGVFYGPNAEEVGGIISLDLNITENGTTEQVNGTGGFAGANDPD